MILTHIIFVNEIPRPYQPLVDRKFLKMSHVLDFVYS